MEQTPAFMKIFTLWANNRPYPLDGPTFSRMSKKCAKLMQNGQTQGVLVRRVRSETITAFTAACQLQPFKVTRNSAYELLDIAYEWEVATLIKFVNDYIQSKGINRPHDIDCIAELVKHCKKKNYLESDIIAVSNIINTALADPRFPEVPPEMIYRIVTAADPRSIDQQLLLDFVIFLFNENAMAAVPLITLIDFSRFTNDQYEGVFQCKEIHEEVINFFLAWSLSNLRNKADRERVQADSRHYAEMSTMRELVQKALMNAIAKIKTEHEEREREMKQKIKDQNDEIENLLDTTSKMAQQLKEKEKQHNAKLNEIAERIKKMDEHRQEIEEIERNLAEIIEEEVAQKIAPYHDHINEEIQKASEKNVEELHAIKDSFDAPIDEAQELTESYMTILEEYNDKITDENARLLDNKAALAVKMIKDKLRSVKYIKDKESKFGVFDRPRGFWGVNAKEAREAEQQIIELTKRLNALCPLDDYD